MRISKQSTWRSAQKMEREGPVYYPKVRGPGLENVLAKNLVFGSEIVTTFGPFDAREPPKHPSTR